MIKITFPDGSVREYNEGVTGLQIAESISSRLAQDVLACGVNGEIYDLGRPIMQDAEVVLYKWEDEQGKHAFWHTSAHLLAEALQELYPGIQFGIGPAIENGFYYDVDPGETTIKEADLPAIEKKMAELVAKKEAVVRQDIAKADALKMFGDRGETYKCELISELEDGHITTYTQGAFTDLCRGPHLMTTAPIKAIKLTSVAGAYWRGQEDRTQDVAVLRLAALGAVCEHGNGLSAADRVYLVNTEDGAGGEDGLVRQTFLIVAGGRGGDGQRFDAGGLGRHSVHDDGARVDGLAAGHIQADALNRNPAFGHAGAFGDTARCQGKSLPRAL